MVLKRRYIMVLLSVILIMVLMWVFLNYIPLYFAENKPQNIIYKHPKYISCEEVTDNGITSLDVKYYNEDRMIYFSLLEDGSIQTSTLIKHDRFDYEYSPAFTVKDMRESQNILLNGNIDNRPYSINVSKADIIMEHFKDTDGNGFDDWISDYGSVLVCTLRSSEIEGNRILYFVSTKDNKIYKPVDINNIGDYKIFIFRLPYTDLNNINLNNFKLIINA